jgi:hypothetical protein
VPRLSVGVPTYRHHKVSGQAVVTLDGHDYYLGPHGTKVSMLEYDRMVSLCQANGRRMPGAGKGDLTVNELVLVYLKFAAAYYVKDGGPTSEVHPIRAAVRPLVDLVGSQPAAEFGPP